MSKSIGLELAKEHAENKRLRAQLASARAALERIRDGDWNWPKTARDIATEALEKTR